MSELALSALSDYLWYGSTSIRNSQSRTQKGKVYSLLFKAECCVLQDKIIYFYFITYNSSRNNSFTSHNNK